MLFAASDCPVFHPRLLSSNSVRPFFVLFLVNVCSAGLLALSVWTRAKSERAWA